MIYSTPRVYAIACVGSLENVGRLIEDLFDKIQNLTFHQISGLISFFGVDTL